MARKTTPKTPSTTRTKSTRAATKPKSATRATSKTTAPVAPMESAAPTVLPSPEVAVSFGKRDLIDRVVESSGIKKKDAKPVVEAMLRELGEALSRGETLNLQPLGKGIVKARKVQENADVIELRLRRSKQAMAASADAAATAPASGSSVVDMDRLRDPLAEPAE